MNHCTTLLLAQGMNTDVAGWSTFGLTGLVLAWFFLKHLPEKDRRDERKDNLHRQHVQALMQDWKSSLKEILNHCDKETSKVTEAMKEEFRRIRRDVEGKGDDHE